MTRFRFPGCLFVVVVCCFACVPGVWAQSSPVGRSGKSPAPAAVTTAHVRLWKTELRGFPTLRVTMTTPGASKQHPATRDLGSGSPGYVFDNYADFPAGRGTLEVFDAPGTTKPLVSMPTEFVTGKFVTVLLEEPRKAGLPPQVEVIVDGTEDQAGGDASAQIRVRSFVTTIKDLHITLGDVLNAQFTGSDSYLRMRGLRPAVYPVKTVGTGTDGKPFEWTTEADLRQHRSQTLLIFPDPYGRIRPRMSVDGEILAAPAPANDEGR